MAILVTGGAGYIGAHVVSLLADKSEPVVVVDNLSTGVADRLPEPPVQLDLAHSDVVPALTELLIARDVRAVIHFAAKKSVSEAVTEPAYYYRQNVGATAHLLEAMRQAQVPQIVFSSTAAVYGEVDGTSVAESAPLQPVNAYGAAKLACEDLVRFATASWGLQAVNLRYFNVAGAARPELRDSAVMNLCTIAVERARAGIPVEVFGADYPTPDGTCIRDYVHVADLADAHVAALRYASELPAGTTEVFNVGTGRGTSVAEILAELAASGPVPLATKTVGRRSGDPARVVADATKISNLLGWQARHSIADIARSAWW